MSLRQLSTFRLRSSLLLGSLLMAGTFCATAAEQLRQPIAKGVYEMAFSQQENALWVATTQNRQTDKGGVVYRLDPTTLQVTQTIHNDIKPYGAAIDTRTQTLWFGNSTDGMVTAIDAKTGDVKGRVVLDARKRTETERPLQPRQVLVDETSGTVYITGLGKESVIWAVDAEKMTLKNTITGTGTYSTALALDADAKRLYSGNADGELVTIDTATQKVISRKKLLDDGKEHFFINLSLDTAGHRAFVADSKEKALLVVDLRDSKVLGSIAVPEALAVLFNPTRNEVYVTHRQAGQVSVIDAKTLKVTKTFNTPTHPNSLTLSADGKTLYVSVKQAGTRQQPATQPDDIIRIAL